MESLALSTPVLQANVTNISKQNHAKELEIRWNHAESHKSLELFTPDQVDIVETYFTSMDSLTDQMSLTQLSMATLVAQVHTKPYITANTHRYDERDPNIAKWGGPEIDQEACLRQLEQLTERVEWQYKVKSEGEDINLHQLLDTFGWYSSGGLLGNDEWPGNYHECLRLKINSTEGLLATRYCSAAFRGHNWPKTRKLDQILAYRAGVCLPKSCDSIRYKNKFELVERLVKFNWRKVDEDAHYLDYLYCLPDEQSVLRLWYYSPKTVAFVGALTVWIMLLVFATFSYKPSADKSNTEDNNNLYKSLSIVENAKILLNTTPKKKEDVKERRIVNLDVIDGIKVLTLCYIITGHMHMVFSRLVGNAREISEISNLNNLIFHSSNMTPAFFVNVFFSITGLLTAYMTFKQCKSIAKPSTWLAFVAYRYIRIMPIYLLVVMYLKLLAKYTGLGPTWDYGTSSLGERYQCENESWLWTLLFGANFRGIQEHCIPTAWYLANDFQYALVTPLILGLLQKRPKLGKLVIVSVALLSSLSLVAKIVLMDVDLRAMHQFRVNSLKIFLTFMNQVYTQPQYRIAPYLCGLLMGYTLYRYEQAKLVELASESSVKDSNVVKKVVDWPKWMKKYSTLFYVALCSGYLAPVIGKFLRHSKFYCKLSVGCITSTYNLLFGFTTCLFILLASTGHGNQTINKFLASPSWRPLSRLNLCALLVQIEVINYFAQTGTHLLYFDFKTIAAFNLFAIFMTFLVAAIVHVLFELPFQHLTNTYLLSALTRGGKQHKS